jgi:dynein heavy chain
MKNVAALEEKLATTKELDEADASKKEAEDVVVAGERKLNLARRLTGALGSENERWVDNVVALQNNEKLPTGDVLLIGIGIYILHQTFHQSLQGTSHEEGLQTLPPEGVWQKC